MASHIVPKIMKEGEKTLLALGVLALYAYGIYRVTEK